MARYEFERTLKTIVVEKGSNQEETSHIKNSILDQMDAIDAAGEVGSPRFPFKWPAVALATAATIVLCVIAAISLAPDTQTASSDAPEQVTTTSSATHEIDYFMSAHLAHMAGEDAVSSRVDPLDYLFELTGIRLQLSKDFSKENIHSVSVDTIMGIPFGRIEMHSRDNSLVSLFVTPADRYMLPETPVAVVDGREMVMRRCKKCTVVGLEHNDLIFMVVSKACCEPTELVEMTSFF